MVNMRDATCRFYVLSGFWKNPLLAELRHRASINAATFPVVANHGECLHHLGNEIQTVEYPLRGV